MSKKAVGFTVLGIAVMVIVLVVYYSFREESAVPPCSSTQEPDRILEPVAESSSAATDTCKNADGTFSLTVFCLVPCAGDACNEEKTINADYSIKKVSSGIEITLTLKAAGETGETVVEVKKLPASWADKPTYGDHHFLVYRIGCNEGLPCENKYYPIQNPETVAATGVISMTLVIPGA